MSRVAGGVRGEVQEERGVLQRGAVLPRGLQQQGLQGELQRRGPARYRCTHDRRIKRSQVTDAQIGRQRIIRRGAARRGVTLRGGRRRRRLQKPDALEATFEILLMTASLSLLSRSDGRRGMACSRFRMKIELESGWPTSDFLESAAPPLQSVGAAVRQAYNRRDAGRGHRH